MGERRLTVASCLSLPAFADVQATIFAGYENLDREVRWVHSGEIPDLGDYLLGGEMLLTAGLGMGTTAATQRDFVRRVAEAGASVLIVELSGRAFTTMPVPAVTEAERWDLPLIGLSGEVPFVEVSSQIHDLLTKIETERIKTEEKISESFMELLLADADPVTLCRQLTEMTECTTVLEDVTHHIVAYSDGIQPAHEIIADWSRHSRGPHTKASRTLREGEGEPPRAGYDWCLREQIAIRGNSWGWLHLLGTDREAAALDHFTIRRAASAVAISLLSERVRGARLSQRQNALLTRLMLGDISGADFVVNARTLGRDLANRTLIVLATVRHDGFGERALTQLLADAGIGPTVVGGIGDQLVAVAGVDSSDETFESLSSQFNMRKVRAGYTRVSEDARLRRAIEESRLALDAALSAPSDTYLVDFDTLGVLKLLLATATGPELGHYVEGELGALLSHDSTSKNPLLPTLTMYLQQDANKSRTAQSLHVQRRTLYYRLEKIERILQCSLHESDTRLRLRIALRGLELLQRREPQRPRPVTGEAPAGNSTLSRGTTGQHL
ncbi:PucR family transcriptional regulator [Pseudonocardia xinjiangensis]|uniref:PucR family transcriptional regulator n=1 Tax=Pseudonocardia xinjiangensis TaxID=75289 RepID=UPI003D89E4C8